MKSLDKAYEIFFNSSDEAIIYLIRDGLRYRFLRDLPEDSPYEEIGNYPGDMWDAAIDKAMEESNED